GRVILSRVKEQLVSLVRLQHLDERIRTQTKRLASIPDELGEREAAFSAREAAAEQLEAERKSCLARAQHLENDVSKHEERVQKLEEQIHGARDAGAVSVAQHESDALHAKIGAAQEEALQLLEEADRYATERDSARAVVEEQRAELTSFREIVVSDEASLGEVLKELQAERLVLSAPLAETAKQIYAKVAEARNGRAVAVLRGNSCSGCGANLPPNEQVKVGAATALHTCRSCGRILVSQEIWVAGAE
ncbi:MAG: C4-type zinc ribbon domain-containing protein, partial [Planctomycetes bacterium]|nr:C4-type zinc ribbon domain-containing protein [Planctomycetota bacterium]